MKNLLIICGLLLLVTTTCDNNPVESVFDSYVWEVSTPEAEGMNAQVLDSALMQAEAVGFVDGLLVIKNGKIVAENYYNQYHVDRPHNVMSVSKSFLSAITGIALSQGYLDSLEEKVLDYFPEYIYPNIDLRKQNITLRHLLTMRMGIQGESEDNYAVYQSFYNSENWIKTTIEAPLMNDPGQRMRYNTFQTHLLSAIITKATEQSTKAFASEQLLTPMKIDVDSWEQGPQGYYFGGNSMHFTPREMAVLGYLYLNNGRLNGSQIVSESWVSLTLSASTNFSHPNEWGAWKNYNYAYLWWLGQINDYDMFMAYGYGGQFVAVFPTLELIVVATANNRVNPNVSTIQEWAIFDIISDYILPSISN